MANLILPHRWRRQPQFPIEAISTGLGEGLIALPLLSVGGGVKIYNAALNRIPSAHFGTAPSVSGLRTTPFGTGLQFHPSGGASGFDGLYWPPELLGAGSDFTGIWCGYYSSSDSSFADTLCIGEGGDDGVRLEWSSTTNLRFAYIDSSPAQFNLDLTMPTYSGSGEGPLYRHAVVRRGGARFLYDWGSRGRAGPQTTGVVTMRSDAVVGVGLNIRGGHQLTVFMAWWKRGLSDGEVWETLENPWQLFRPLKRRLYIGAAAAGGSFSYTAAGGIVVSGSADVLRLIAPSVAGGLELAGASPNARGRIMPDPTGGLDLAGTSPQLRKVAIEGVGGLDLAGAALPARVTLREVEGGVDFAGAADFTAVTDGELVVEASGGLQFGGAAGVTYTGGILGLAEEGVFSSGGVVQKLNQKNTSVVRTP